MRTDFHPLMQKTLKTFTDSENDPPAANTAILRIGAVRIYGTCCRATNVSINDKHQEIKLF